MYINDIAQATTSHTRLFPPDQIVMIYKTTCQNFTIGPKNGAFTKWDKENHKWSTSYKNMCRSRNWPTLKVRRTLLTYCQLYKIIRKLDCIEFSKYFGYRSLSRLRGHSLSTFGRQGRINSYRYSFFINTPQIWNSLPPDIIQCTSLGSFRQKLCNVNGLLK